ncbi:MAG TPA: hypothetical protein VMG74_08420 [Gaiellaceae bacterium]|nr:hypothetical protein [Gaiellaceae bacterium]
MGGWWRRRKGGGAGAREREDELRHQTPAERRVSSGDLTALKSNERAARMMLEPNVASAERLAEGSTAPERVRDNGSERDRDQGS